MTHAIPTGASLHVLAGVDHLRFDWTPLMHAVEPILTRIAQDGAAQGMKQVRRYVKAMKKSEQTDDEKLVTLPNPRAKQWAHERAAALIGKKILPDGTLADNPDAKWAITESTREKIRALVSEAVETGKTNDELADELEKSYAFSHERAETIALTETRIADVHGTLIGYQELGVPRKESLLSNDHEDEDECDTNAAQGPIPIEDAFESGDDGPAYHPHCYCDLGPVMDEMPEGFYGEVPEGSPSSE